MLKMLELREMIKLVSKSPIQEFSLKNKGVRVLMKKSIPEVTTQKISEVDQENFQNAYKEAAAALEVRDPESSPIPMSLKEDAKEPLLHQIVSPFIGVFSSSSAPGAKPFVKVGDRVSPNTIIGSSNVEPLKLFQQIASDVDGEITEILVDDGELVEYGQPLFLVKAE
ncbi:biotin/lipoyl-containing protein [Bacillus sp. OK048]|uniref:biotin/lipoyl-containing protein n=1 Tax=Bacillus sp. OK048 TaxID=1882761 RepID=UPI00087F4BF8|nr:biotin/lipoyl-containing protein [Bacillus sp. OK048]SDL95317.1 acetyl-CoA carboxylase biotin carboxyl carrier protein [Bacillus sp. OK048]